MFSECNLAEFFGKSNTFCINSHWSAYFLIVKNMSNLHFVKFSNNYTFVLITFYAQNLSSRYKSSKPANRVPLFLARTLFGENFGGSEELLYLCAIKNKYDENGKQF